MRRYKSILVISDQHFPYAHKDIIPFLSEVKSVYRPDKVVNIGDEVDYHYISFHEHNPNLFAPSDELQKAIEAMQPLYKLFPCMDLLESNHGSLVYRKAIAAGLPREVFKNYRQILKAPKNWRWHDRLILHANNGSKILFRHGLSSDCLKNSKNVSMCFVQGHYHSKYEIRYWANSEKLMWGVTTGCLIDNDSRAFDYNKTTLDRPIIGVTAIVNGLPQLIPMVLNKHGRWVGKL